MKKSNITKKSGNVILVGFLMAALLSGCMGTAEMRANDDENNTDENAAAEKSALNDNEAEVTEDTAKNTSGDENSLDDISIDAPFGIGETRILENISDVCSPMGIMPVGDGSFLISDTYTKVVWKVSDKESTVFCGSDGAKDIYEEPVGGYNDAEKNKALFSKIFAIAPFDNGYALTDSENKVIRLVREDAVTTIAPISKDGKKQDSGSISENPTGLATDKKGTLFVAATPEGKIYGINVKGEIKEIVSGLDSPMGMSFYRDELYVCETGKNRIIKISSPEISLLEGKATYEVVAGTGESGFVDGVIDKASFSSPKGITVSDSGIIFVSDTVNGSVRYIADGMVGTVISPTWELDTWPVSPVGICYNADKLYVCDNFSKKVYVIPIEKN